MLGSIDDTALELRSPDSGASPVPNQLGDSE